MNFIESSKILIPALSGLTMTVCDLNKMETLAQFEKSFCVMPDVQPIFTANGLLRFFEQNNEKNIYMVTDALNIHCVIIKIEDKWIVLGPYVADPWQNGEAKATLLRIGARDDSFLPYKNYYCSLPVINDEFSIRTAALLLVNTVGNPPREVKYLDLSIHGIEDIPPKISEDFEELAIVKHRYELEDKFIDAIRQGSTAQALHIFSEMNSYAKGLRFMSDSLRDQIAAAAIMRAIIRRAALQAGLMPVLVDALSQEYAQKMHLTTDNNELRDLEMQYISAFCTEVRLNRKKGESPQVRQAIQYIEVHLSRQISVDEVCEACGVSRKRLVHLFKDETGFTIKQYIARARCERAMDLLSNNQLRIQEIGFYVGYEDTNYFARIFKSVMGMSPQEYREKKSF